MSSSTTSIITKIEKLKRARKFSLDLTDKDFARVPEEEEKIKSKNKDVIPESVKVVKASQHLSGQYSMAKDYSEDGKRTMEVVKDNGIRYKLKIWDDGHGKYSAEIRGDGLRGDNEFKYDPYSESFVPRQYRVIKKTGYSYPNPLTSHGGSGSSYTYYDREEIDETPHAGLARFNWKRKREIDLSDINEIRYAFRNIKNVSEYLDEFFIVTPEQRKAYTEFEAKRDEERADGITEGLPVIGKIIGPIRARIQARKEEYARRKQEHKDEGSKKRSGVISNRKVTGGRE